MSQEEPNAVTNITGNAETTTKLRNTRLINNVSFDGTSDIRIVDFRNAVGSDGNLIPTQSYLDSCISTIQDDINTANNSINDVSGDFSKTKTDTTTQVGDVKTEFDTLKTTSDKALKDCTTSLSDIPTTVHTTTSNINDELSKFKTSTDAATSSINSDISKLKTDTDASIKQINDSADDLNTIVGMYEHANSSTVDRLKRSVESLDSHFGTKRVELAFVTGNYRINSTGRPIQLNITGTTDGRNSLFVTQINTESLIPGVSDSVQDIYRMTLSGNVDNGTMTAIIAPGEWWSIKWVQEVIETGSGSATVWSIQDRPDFKGLKHYTNGRTQFQIDKDGSEDMYIGTNWKPMA